MLENSCRVVLFSMIPREAWEDQFCYTEMRRCTTSLMVDSYEEMSGPNHYVTKRLALGFCPRYWLSFVASESIPEYVTQTSSRLHHIFATRMASDHTDCYSSRASLAIFDRVTQARWRGTQSLHAGWGLYWAGSWEQNQWTGVTPLWVQFMYWGRLTDSLVDLMLSEKGILFETAVGQTPVPYWTLSLSQKKRLQ